MLHFETLEEFYAYCDALEPDEFGCKYDPNHRGRCAMQVRMGDGHYYVVSRLSLERRLGRKIKPGYYACHRCNTSKCVNSNHIYEGTPKDNARNRLDTNPKLMREITKQVFLIQKEAREILRQVNKILWTYYDGSRRKRKGPEPSETILKQLRRNHIQKWNKVLEKINANRNDIGLPPRRPRKRR